MTTRRLPVTTALIAVNVIVYLAMLRFGAGLSSAANAVQLAWGANFAPATVDGEWWRLGSAMFLHFGIAHLATNMLALADSGRFVERMYGHGRFFAIYACSGILGNLMSLVVHGERTVSGGASGAVFGVYGALLTYLFLHRGVLPRRESRWLFFGAAAFTVIAGAFGAIVPGIDNAAHIGGLAAGILAGLALAPGTRAGEARRRWPRALAAGALAAGAIGLAVAIPAPSYRWSEEQLAQRRINEFLAQDHRINAIWNAIMQDGKSGIESPDQVIGRLESEVAGKYQQSFEQLSALHPDPASPSAPALDFVRKYAERRRDASRQLVEGLKESDLEKVRAALKLARDASRSKPDGAASTAR